MSLFLSKGTIELKSAPSIKSYAATVGKKEGDGPLADYFDHIAEDVTMGEKSWEKSESLLQQSALRIALEKGNLSERDISFIFAGDLLNQCTSSSYGLRDYNFPYIGIYGACSNMAESLALAGIFIDNGIGDNAAAITSSHFCSAERQYRFPLNYGAVRSPTSQWTVTGAGCAIVSSHWQPPYIKFITFGSITDMGIKDANNMGAAMAGAAYETISAHLANTNKNINNFDLIITGDLGKIGSDLLYDLFKRNKVDIKHKHKDCGTMIFDTENQKVNAGGSGCGCSASVLCGYILRELAHSRIKNVLFVATGALLSPTMTQQGESIPGIAHALHLSAQ
ncbi:MAG: stage V sporulation protein AD [Eubacterium sp.]|jgi:stage V sporulation protein AD|nr:stage V sporulation protein AD [Eubacterium sp.]